MELNASGNPNKLSYKLVSRIGRAFRSEKDYSQEAVEKRNKKESAKLKKRNKNAPSIPNQADELGERHEYAIFGNGNATLADSKVKDHGEMMHGLAHRDSFDSLLDAKVQEDPYSMAARRRRRQGMIVSPEHEQRIAQLPKELWQRVALFLTPIEAVHLALSSKTLYAKLGLMPFETLNSIDNRAYKHAFLHQMDSQYPNHLLCFPCGKYHKRLQPGKETLKIDYVQNPVFICPNVKASILPRMRLTYGRELPYAYIQLALRAAQHGPNYGMDHEKLARRWTCKTSKWTHQTRYMIHDHRLLLRVRSQIHTPPARSLTETAERHLLYDREEYTPFFSVCPHWRDGDLMKICKCMMHHVPAPPDPYRKQIQRGLHLSRAAAHPDFLVRGCDDCRPARRCPECPTEYLIEVQMVEDWKDKITPFKHALVVTRWSDLGDGRGPYASPEWAAITGSGSGSGNGYESFTNVGRRAVGGIFESNVSGATPGQRLISLNPKNKKLGEEGHGWY